MFVAGDITEQRSLYVRLLTLVSYEILVRPPEQPEVDWKVLPYLVALRTVIVEHAPSERLGRAIDSRDCPEHNPLVQRRPDQVDLDMDLCPNCKVTSYVHCSSHGCYSCDYPCDTLTSIGQSLGLVPAGEEDSCP